MTAIKQNSTRSELWQLPIVSDSRDDEFDGTSLSPSWVTYDAGTSLPATLSANTVNTYDTAFSGTSTIRVTVQDSWVNLQTPGNSIYFGLSKAVTIGTNVLVYARIKVNIKTTGTHTNSDYTIGMGLFQNIGGIADWNNNVLCYMNSPNTNNIQAQSQRHVGGVLTVNLVSDNVGRSGSPLEYVAIHKIGTTYHNWVGTASGNWLYMGSTTTALTMAYIGFIIANATTATPGVGVVGVDFVRFIDTSNFLL